MITQSRINKIKAFKRENDYNIKVNSILIMDHIRDSSSSKDKVMVSLNGMITQFTKENGMTIISMDGALVLGLIKESIKENGTIIRCME